VGTAASTKPCRPAPVSFVVRHWEKNVDYLTAFLKFNFLLNEKVHKGKNPDSIYLAGFTGDHIQRLREKAIEIISQAKRVALVVDFENQTWPRAVGAATGIFSKKNPLPIDTLRLFKKKLKLFW
jgi:hypothetical protein